MTLGALAAGAAVDHVDFLLESGHPVPIRRYDDRLLSIFTKDVLARVRSDDPAWETMDPISFLEDGIFALKEDVSKSALGPRLLARAGARAGSADTREDLVPMFSDMGNGECQVQPLRRV